MSEIDELRAEIRVLREQVDAFRRIDLVGGGFGGNVDVARGNVMVDVREEVARQIAEAQPAASLTAMSTQTVQAQDGTGSSVVDASGSSDERLNRIEWRLDRIEAALRGASIKATCVADGITVTLNLPGL